MNSKINQLRNFFRDVCKTYHEKNFQRNRKLNFTHMLYFLLKINFKDEIYSSVNKSLKNNNIVNVSKQALAKKRQLINCEDIKDIFNKLVKHAYNSGIIKNTFTYAIDGSKISYKKCLSFEGFKLTPCKTYTKALLSTVYDVDNKIPVNCTVTRKFDEREAVIKDLITTFKKDDIVIFDRGYFSKKLVTVLNQNKLKFVFRMVKSSTLVKTLNDNKIDDNIFFIEDESYKFFMRVVKYTIEKTDYYLGTNMFFEDITYLSNLYHKRWFVEEFYKTIKSDLKANNLSCNNFNKNQQNIYSQMIIDILARYLEILTEYYLKKCPKNYQLNHRSSIRSLNDNIIYLLLFKKSNHKLIKQLHILKIEVVYCKPNRRFKRIRISPVSKWYFDKKATPKNIKNVIKIRKTVI